MKTMKTISSLLLFTLFVSDALSQDISAYEIMERVFSIKKPQSSIMEIRLEVFRKKGKKIKKKIREFIRYEKNYEKGKYRLKSMARFTKPDVVKGTSLLSWVNNNGKTEQWFFLPKLKSVKKVKAKERSKSFLNTDFIYEDLESREPGLDSLISLGTEFIDGQLCKIIMAWPKNKSTYFSRKLWINTNNWAIVKIEFYLNESKKHKTLQLSDFIERNGFYTPGKLQMETSEGNKTIMHITSYRPDIGLNEEIFSKSFLVKY